MKMNLTLLPIDSIPVFTPTWDEISGKAHLYKTARLRSCGRYVAIRGVRNDMFVVSNNEQTFTVSTAELCDFGL